jgi:hypothetical protein
VTYFLPIVVVWLVACFVAGLWFRALEREEQDRARDLDTIVAHDWIVEWDEASR